MKNVIISQLYELRKNRTVFLFCFGVLILCIAICWMVTGWTETSKISETVADNGLQVISMFVRTSILIITGCICAGDFPDKTINHEITSGTLRKDAFFGRAVLAIVLSEIIAIVTILLCLAIMSALYGWGDTVTLDSALKRVFLLVFPYFKYSCFAVMISFIVKQPYAAFLFVILATIVYTSVIRGSEIVVYLLSDVTAAKICTYNSYATYGLETEVRMIYDQSIDTDLIAGAVIASLIIGALYLIIGYHYYNKDDLN